MMLQTLEDVLYAAKQWEPCTMAVAAAQDADVLTAVYSAAEQGLIKPLLVGHKEDILRIAQESGLPVKEEEVIHEPDKEAACMKAAALVRDKKADLLMKGMVDTSLMMRAVLSRDNDLKKSLLISHVGVLEVPGYDRLFYVTDSAMNLAPTLEQKAAILKNAVEVAHALGNEVPKAAVLCAVEKVNPKMPCTLDARALAYENQHGEIQGCLVDGPLALDNAVSLEAAKHKGINGPVAGRADILLAPDIEAGNILNKSMEYFGRAKKAGIMMGAKIPIVLTSRAASPQSKMYSIALGVLIASKTKEHNI